MPAWPFAICVRRRALEPRIRSRGMVLMCNACAVLRSPAAMATNSRRGAVFATCTRTDHPCVCACWGRICECLVEKPPRGERDASRLLTCRSSPSAWRAARVAFRCSAPTCGSPVSTTPASVSAPRSSSGSMVFEPTCAWRGDSAARCASSPCQGNSSVAHTRRAPRSVATSREGPAPVGASWTRRRNGLSWRSGCAVASSAEKGPAARTRKRTRYRPRPERDRGLCTGNRGRGRSPRGPLK
jgi:hypothetical protein